MPITWPTCGQTKPASEKMLPTPTHHAIKPPIKDTPSVLFDLYKITSKKRTTNLSTRDTTRLGPELVHYLQEFYWDQLNNWYIVLQRQWNWVSTTTSIACMLCGAVTEWYMTDQWRILIRSLWSVQWTSEAWKISFSFCWHSSPEEE